MAEDQTDTYRQVFGGDDSDLSDEEVQPRVQQQQQPTRRSPSASRSRSRSVTPARSEDGGEYVPATEDSAAKYPKFKKTAGKRRQADADESQPRRAKKKRVRRERESGDEGVEEEEAPVVYDEATLKRMALDAKFESIGKKATGKKRKSKKNQDDDLDAMHDEEINRLRDTMLDAAYQDEEANRARKPATHKLEMLDQVTAILQNSTLGQSIIDNGLLTAVTAWLKPLPDKSLPALGIQKAFFEVLPKMEIDTATLKECRLGPIVDFYTKTKRVPPSISRSANQLYDTWYRLVTGRSASLRQKPVRDIDVDDEPLAERGERARTNKRFNAEKATEENKGRKGATLPRTTQTRYTLAPVPKTQHHAEDLEHVTRLQQDNRKFNKFKSAKGRAAR